jgi:hypothetical protein
LRDFFEILYTIFLKEWGMDEISLYNFEVTILQKIATKEIIVVPNPIKIKYFIFQIPTIQ